MAASVLIVERNEKIGALVAGQLREKGYEAADELAVHWDLPAEVRTAIGAHHAPGSSNQHKRLAAMVHISDIAVRTMKIGFAGDDLSPAMDPYAQRLQKSVEEITKNKDDFLSQIESMIGT